MPQYRTPRYRQRTVKRPTTTFKCRWVPNRDPPRKWDARSAARAMCYAIAQGATRAEIVKLSEERCPIKGERPQLANEAAMAAIAALENSNDEMQSAFDLFLKVNAVLLALVVVLGVLRLAGPLRLVGIPARAAVQQMSRLVQARMDSIVTGKAANDAAIALLRQAA